MCRKQLLSLWLIDKGKQLRLSKLKSLEKLKEGVSWNWIQILEENYQVSVGNSRNMKKDIPELRLTSLTNKCCPVAGVISGNLRRELWSKNSACWEEGSLIMVGILEVEGCGRLLEVLEKTEIASNYCWNQSLLSWIKINCWNMLITTIKYEVVIYFSLLLSSNFLYFFFPLKKNLRKS